MSPSIVQFDVSRKIAKKYRTGDDLLVDGIVALSKMDATIPLHNLLANGNVERELKMLMASAIQKKHPEITYVMEKRFAYKGGKSPHRLDLLLVRGTVESIAVECKCTFAFDTRRKVIVDAKAKVMRQAKLADPKPDRNYIVHFLSYTKFSEDRDFLPNRLRAVFDELYRKKWKCPIQVMEMYQGGDDPTHFKRKTVVESRDEEKRLRFAALILELQKIGNYAEK